MLQSDLAPFDPAGEDPSSTEAIETFEEAGRRFRQAAAEAGGESLTISYLAQAGHAFWSAAQLHMERIGQRGNGDGGAAAASGIDRFASDARRAAWSFGKGACVAQEAGDHAVAAEHFRAAASILERLAAVAHAHGCGRTAERSYRDAADSSNRAAAALSAEGDHREAAVMYARAEHQYATIAELKSQTGELHEARRNTGRADQARDQAAAERAHGGVAVPAGA